MKIILNGEEVEIVGYTLNYSEIVKLAGEGHQPSVTYSNRKTGQAGILHPGKTLELNSEGMVINAFDTSNA